MVQVAKTSKLAFELENSLFIPGYSVNFMKIDLNLTQAEFKLRNGVLDSLVKAYDQEDIFNV